SRHDDSVGRKRECHLSVSVLEANSLAGQLIDCRGLGAAIPVATEVIGARGVYRNQHYRIRRRGGADLDRLQRRAQAFANSPEKEKTHDPAVTPVQAHKIHSIIIQREVSLQNLHLPGFRTDTHLAESRYLRPR